MPIRRRAALAAPILFSLPARAQEWPQRSLRFIVPFAPGGASDAMARIIAAPLERALGRPVVVDNRGGAGTTTGTAEALRGNDGHTLLLAALPFVINQYAMPSLPYAPERDFAPVALLATGPVVLVARNGLATDWAGVAAAARARPGALTYGSAGNGSLPHVAFELLKLRSGIDVLHVPYRGGGPAVVDMIAGRVDLMLASPLEVVAQIRAGQLTPIAAASATRIPLWPDLPTLQEAGLVGMDVNGWFGAVMPATTPVPAVERLNAALQQVLAQPEVATRLRDIGAEPTPGPPQRFADWLAAERRRWSEAVAAARIRIE